ncbi:MAG TPA: MFS transporter [Steroidobacteraceae bacterium]
MAERAAAPDRPVSFAAFQHRGYRFYFLGNATAMLADNIEHVISYWVLYQKFHSPALAGFAVISHWVPYLLFSGYSGALADRFDPRRMIQLGMLLFMLVSMSWGVLILTGTLQTWHAVILLSLHGFAGVLWTPPAQLLIYDIVPLEQLPSAVRLGATARYCGTLLGPAVGSALMLAIGPARGIFLNALIYLPMLLWLWKAPYGWRFHAGQAGPRPAAAVRGLGDALSTLRHIRGDRILLLMTLLAGAASFFVGTAYQAQMPGFAIDLGHGDPGVFYFALAAADAGGALFGALVLESRGLLQPRAQTALLLAMLWCCALSVFALARHYLLALAALFCAGFLELSFNAMAQALVQLHAPVALRGRIIGVFAMSSLGLRFFSGITVGLIGEVVGIHVSLALAAAGLFLTVLGLRLRLSSSRAGTAAAR